MDHGGVVRQRESAWPVTVLVFNATTGMGSGTGSRHRGEMAFMPCEMSPKGHECDQVKRPAIFTWRQANNWLEHNAIVEEGTGEVVQQGSSREGRANTASKSLRDSAEQEGVSATRGGGNIQRHEQSTRDMQGYCRCPG